MPADVETVVLLRSRRRCCICYGLYRNTALKRGQIAHLNEDPSDNAADNLAFLCLDHHDEYDSTTSQSKGLTLAEVKHFRSELDDLMASLAPAPVPEEGAGMVERQAVEGRYVRLPGYESAEISVAALPGAQGEFRVTGLALWGTRRGAPRTGDIDFTASMQGDRLEYRDMASGNLFSMTLRFQPDGLVVEEQGSNPSAGLNVTFTGEYRRA